MRIKSIISHASVGCAAALATYLAASGQLGVPASFAQAPAPPSGLRSTELFNRVMDDVLGRRYSPSGSPSAIPAMAARRTAIPAAIPSAISWRAPTR